MCSHAGVQPERGIRGSWRAGRVAYLGALAGWLGFNLDRNIIFDGEELARHKLPFVPVACCQAGVVADHCAVGEALGEILLQKQNPRLGWLRHFPGSVVVSSGKQEGHCCSPLCICTPPAGFGLRARREGCRAPAAPWSTPCTWRRARSIQLRTLPCIEGSTPSSRCTAAAWAPRLEEGRWC